MKQCSKCKKIKVDSDFNKKSRNKDGLQARCKECLQEFHKSHYESKKQYYKDKAVKHNAVYRVRNLEYMIHYLLDHPCIDCGEFNPKLLEFDHRGNKAYDVSTMTTLSLHALDSEIAKCDIRCVECHKRRTAQQFGHYKNVRIPIMNLIDSIQALIKQLKDIKSKEDKPRFYFNNYWSHSYNELRQEFAKVGLIVEMSHTDFFTHNSNEVTVLIVEHNEFRKYEDRDKHEIKYAWTGDSFLNKETGTIIPFDYADVKADAAKIALSIKEAIICDITLFLSAEVNKRTGNPAVKLKFSKTLGQTTHW